VTGDRRAEARAHAFVTDLDRPELEPHDRHHLERVLRLRGGELITLSNGRGHWRRYRFGTALEPEGALEFEPRPVPALTIGFALVKGTRPEWVVQKLTELGVDRVVPFQAERSVVRWDDGRAGRHAERLGLAAREAAMQCRAVWLPTVEPVRCFAEASARPGTALAERGGDPPTLEHPVVLIGPEGGWSDAERANGLPGVGLGDSVLRAETAAVVAGALLVALREGIVGPSAAAHAP
jgi:16S rRNA (uracil1498-N3)-methyltransferase